MSIRKNLTGLSDIEIINTLYMANNKKKRVSRITFIKYTHNQKIGRDRMIVGFTTTYAIRAYHH
jgi:hypothetical protein